MKVFILIIALKKARSILNAPHLSYQTKLTY